MQLGNAGPSCPPAGKEHGADPPLYSTITPKLTTGQSWQTCGVRSSCLRPCATTKHRPNVFQWSARRLFSRVLVTNSRPRPWTPRRPPASRESEAPAALRFLANLKWRWTLASLLVPKHVWRKSFQSFPQRENVTLDGLFPPHTFKFEVGRRVEDEDLFQLGHFSAGGDALGVGTLEEYLTSGSPGSPATSESTADWLTSASRRASMWLQIVERAGTSLSGFLAAPQLIRLQHNPSIFSFKLEYLAAHTHHKKK